MKPQDTHKAIWENDVYKAWIDKYGNPAAYAKRIALHPEKMLGSLSPFFENPSQLKVLNLMGSVGVKSIALATMGANVTIVDFSNDNYTYFSQMRDALGLNIDYCVEDVLKLEAQKLHTDYDVVFAEMGILHYFQDLGPFFNVFYHHLKTGGKLLIRDFHPITTKLISSRGSTAKVRKHKVDGDYFDSDLIASKSAVAKYNDTEEQTILLRKWTLGEVVTAIATAGFKIEALIEEPNLSSDIFDKGIPKTYIISASKL